MDVTTHTRIPKHMNKALTLILIFGLISSCSEQAKPSGNYRKLRELDLQAIELGHTNKKLGQLLTEDSASIASLRTLTDSIVNRIIDIKYGLIDATGGIQEYGTLYDFFNPTNVPITQAYLFEGTETSAPAAKEIIDLINKFDQHPLNLEPLTEFLKGILNENESELERELFDQCNLNEAVEMIEVIEKRILYAEHKVILEQMEQSGNIR